MKYRLILQIVAGFVGDPDCVAVEADSCGTVAYRIITDELAGGVVQLRDGVRA